jgi:hypothetical protein
MPIYEAIAIWAQKSGDFKALPLPMALEMARPKNVTIFRAHPFPMAFEIDVGGGAVRRVFTNYLLRIEPERRFEGQ